MFKKHKTGMVTSEQMLEDADRIGRAIIDAAVVDMGNRTRVIPEALSQGIAAALLSVCKYHRINVVPVLEEAMRLVREEWEKPDVEAN